MSNLSDGLRRVRREVARRSIFAFAIIYFSDHLKKQLSEAHHEIYAVLQDALKNRGKKIAIAGPRSFGKTTLITTIFVLYCIVFRLERFIVILSATSGLANQLLEHVRRELENNKRLLEDFPELAGPRPSPWTKSEIETPTHVRILALGVGQHIRGRKFGKFRPSLIIADDVENRANCQTAELREKLARWFHQDILRVGSEETNFVFLGTIPHSECLLQQLLRSDANPSWIKMHYKAVQSEPSHPELWDQWSRIYNNREKYNDLQGPAGAKKFREDKGDIMDEGVTLLWPSRWTYQDMRIIYEEDPIGFYAEYQNSPLSPADCVFDLEACHFFISTKYKSTDEFMAVMNDHMDYTGACDLAVGENVGRGDYTAIIVLGRDRRDGILYLMEADITRQKSYQTVEMILAYHQKYRFKRFGIETNQFQVLVAEQLDKLSRERGLYVPTERIKHTTNKAMRIQRLQPPLKSGAIQLNQNHRMLLEQIRYFPKGRYDDALDALEMALYVTERSRQVKVTIVGGRGRGGFDDEDYGPFNRAVRGY